jgi:hypothetical protein
LIPRLGPVVQRRCVVPAEADRHAIVILVLPASAGGMPYLASVPILPCHIRCDREYTGVHTTAGSVSATAPGVSWGSGIDGAAPANAGAAILRKSTRSAKPRKGPLAGLRAVPLSCAYDTRPHR